MTKMRWPGVTIKFGCSGRAREDFQRNLPSELHISRTIHFAHAASTQQRQQLVGAELPSNQRASIARHFMGNALFTRIESTFAHGTPSGLHQNARRQSLIFRAARRVFVQQARDRSLIGQLLFERLLLDRF